MKPACYAVMTLEPENQQLIKVFQSKSTVSAYVNSVQDRLERYRQRINDYSIDDDRRNYVRRLYNAELAKTRLFIRFIPLNNPPAYRDILLEEWSSVSKSIQGYK